MTWLGFAGSVVFCGVGLDENEGRIRHLVAAASRQEPDAMSNIPAGSGSRIFLAVTYARSIDAVKSRILGRVDLCALQFAQLGKDSCVVVQGGCGNTKFLSVAVDIVKSGDPFLPTMAHMVGNHGVE